MRIHFFLNVSVNGWDKFHGELVFGVIHGVSSFL